MLTKEPRKGQVLYRVWIDDAMLPVVQKVTCVAVKGTVWASELVFAVREDGTISPNAAVWVKIPVPKYKSSTLVDAAAKDLYVNKDNAATWAIVRCHARAKAFIERATELRMSEK